VGSGKDGQTLRFIRPELVIRIFFSARSMTLDFRRNISKKAVMGGPRRRGPDINSMKSINSVWSAKKTVQDWSIALREQCD
jgi:hypothetical protein